MYRHQSTQSVDDSFYVTNYEATARKLFTQYKRGINDYNNDNGVDPGDVIQIEGQEWEEDPYPCRD